MGQTRYGSATRDFPKEKLVGRRFGVGQALAGVTPRKIGRKRTQSAILSGVPNYFLDNFLRLKSILVIIISKSPAIANAKANPG